MPKGNPNYPDRQDDADMAMAILAEVTTPKAIAAAVVNDNAPRARGPCAAASIVYVDRPVPAPEPATVVDALPAVNGNGSTGDLIGQACDVLHALRLADALPIEATRVPLAALISVLFTKNGSQIA